MSSDSPSSSEDEATVSSSNGDTQDESKSADMQDSGAAQEQICKHLNTSTDGMASEVAKELNTEGGGKEATRDVVIEMLETKRT